MNKAELVNRMAEEAAITKKQATIAIEAMIDEVSKYLKKGKRVTLVGFGTFTVIKRKARKGRNPATGESIRVPAKKVVKFKQGYELQELLD